MYSELNGKTILITGSTGFIGKSLAAYLLEHTQAKVIAEARNPEKFKTLFAPHINNPNLRFLEHDLLTPYAGIAPDYIVHTAAPTASAFFIEHPVETIETITVGTKNVLELARDTSCMGTVVLSSLEAYGTPFGDALLTEEKLGYLDTMAVRNSYPEAKRLAEAYVAAYASEYDVRAMSVRLAQTFGPGIERDDERVFAQFIRAALTGTDIKLLSSGKTKQMYISIHDAITAILTILCKGKAGETYNAANENNFTSIYDMAKMVARILANNQINVLTNTGDAAQYPNERTVYQDTAKLKALGWAPTDDLQKMYKETAESFHIQTV